MNPSRSIKVSALSAQFNLVSVHRTAEYTQSSSALPRSCRSALPGRQLLCRDWVGPEGPTYDADEGLPAGSRLHGSTLNQEML